MNGPGIPMPVIQLDPEKSSRIGAMTTLLGSFALASWLVGYAIWVIYAMRHDLGWLDPWAMKGRAIMAGILPALLLGAFYPLTYFVRRFYRWTQREVKPWERALGGILMLAGMCALGLFILFDFFADELNPWTTRFASVWAFCWLTAALFTGKGADRFHKILAVGYVAFVVGIMLLGLTVVYGWFVFPDLPQELGGPGSRCVVLDFDPGRVSAQTIGMLGAAGASGTPGQSKQIQLILETDESVYVRTAPPSGGAHEYFQLGRGVIRGVLNCPAE